MYRSPATTALANRLGAKRDVFEYLASIGWVEKGKGPKGWPKWLLTKEGERVGGTYKKYKDWDSERSWITWPTKITEHPLLQIFKESPSPEIITPKSCGTPLTLEDPPSNITNSEVFEHLLNGVDPDTRQPLEEKILQFLQSPKIQRALLEVTARNDNSEWPPPTDIPEGHALNEESYLGTSPLEIVRDLKVDYPDALVFIQSGYFYEVYDEDAYFCSNLFGWKIADKGNSSEFTGVPIGAFRFKNELQAAEQSYIIVIQSEFPSTKDSITRVVNEVYSP